MTVRGAGSGFVGWGIEVPTPVFALGSAVAAAEMALPFALLVLFGGDLVALGRARVRRRDGSGTRLFGTFRGRLALALLVSGAVPLAAGAVMVRTALDRSSARATERHALQLLTEGRRLLEERVEGTPSPAELNRAASVVGVDLLLYRDGVLAAASRAVPVAAGLAPERLASLVAAALANGASEAAVLRAPVRPGARRVAEAAVTLSREERTTLAVVLGEDAAGREAVDALVLLAVGVALGALALGGRGALELSRPARGSRRRGGTRRRRRAARADPDAGDGRPRAARRGVRRDVREGPGTDGAPRARTGGGRQRSRKPDPGGGSLPRRGRARPLRESGGRRPPPAAAHGSPSGSPLRSSRPSWRRSVTRGRTRRECRSRWRAARRSCVSSWPTSRPTPKDTGRSSSSRT